MERNHIKGSELNDCAIYTFDGDRMSLAEKACCLRALEVRGKMLPKGFGPSMTSIFFVAGESSDADSTICARATH